ncbi:hypothetical protein D3C76_569950 [compost metagenome]
MAAEYLDAQLRRLVAGLGQEALGNRREQGQPACCRLAHARGGAVVQQVDAFGTGVGEHATAFGVGLLGQQHAPYIGVADDRVGRLVGPQARCGAHLQAVAGIRQGTLERSFSVGLGLL